MSRYDGRMALANAAALGRAGITERTPDPPGGAIVRDAQRLSRPAFSGTRRWTSSPAWSRKMTPEQRLHAVKRALEQAESLGVTSVQDIGATHDDVGVYADLANRGELTVRIYAHRCRDRLVRPGEARRPSRVRIAVAAHRRVYTRCSIAAATPPSDDADRG